MNEKKFVCKYPLKNGWTKYYSIDETLTNVGSRKMVTNSLSELTEYTEFYISEHGHLCGVLKENKFVALLTNYSGDIIFYDITNSYYQFLAKIKNGNMLCVIHFPRKVFTVCLDEIPSKEVLDSIDSFHGDSFVGVKSVNW